MGIALFGTDDYFTKIKASLIYRSSGTSVPKSPFLITTKCINDLSSIPNIDIIRLTDINLRLDDIRKLRHGIGLEVTVSDLRQADGKLLGKWIADISSLYVYCKHAGFQFILSSGASSICEMVSGRSFDALLRTCDIDPLSYWNDLNNWLQSRLLKRCISLVEEET